MKRLSIFILCSVLAVNLCYVVWLRRNIYLQTFDLTTSTNPQEVKMIKSTNVHVESKTSHRRKIERRLSADTENHHKIIYSRLNEVISETGALLHQPCQDKNTAANARLSTLALLDSPDTVYEIGDKIHVLATLFDSSGERKWTGGDHLRSRIWNNIFSAPGSIYDYKNGSYLLIFTAFWSGKSQISATIAYTREAITAFYRMPYEVLSLRTIKAKFKVQNYEEVTLCHPNMKHLLAHTKHKYACNFTSLNSGMPWYCGKPKNPNLKCSDWKFVKSSLPKLPLTISKCEKELLYFRSHQMFSKTITVTVKERMYYNGRKDVEHIIPSIPCSKYNTTKLWERKTTTGFFYNMRWQLTHCQGFESDNFQECLRNKKLYLIGDSTTRQWYKHFLDQYNCTQYTEIWTSKTWKRLSGCTVKNNNFTVIMAPHCQPFNYVNGWTPRNYTQISISKHLESIPSNEDAIVVIHLFLHMRGYHHDCFRNKMQAIRASTQKLIETNKKVKMFIKLPHTFTQNFQGYDDFFGYVFTDIIFKTFHGLYDRIIVLDNKDATNAIASVPMHPHNFVVESMVDQMLSYLC